MTSDKFRASLPRVDFCGLRITRLIIGANPFGGYSHQNPERDKEMVSYHTIDRILETWSRAENAGINTMITNNKSPHVVEAVKQYLSAGGKLQWIAQVNIRLNPNMSDAIDEVIRIGCKALYFHGFLVDETYARRDEKNIRTWFEHARKYNLPVGVAGHSPMTHMWVDSLGLADFHCVPFFNCGSLHEGKGDKFSLDDIQPAIDCINRLQKPCIGYKIMGAGRIAPRMAFEYAFEHIKPRDVVNVGMHRGDKDDMVEENCSIVRKILTEQEISLV